MDALKYIRWNDLLKRYKAQLDETVREAKKVNTAYQNYLAANPYKAKKGELEKNRKVLIDKILKMIEIGHEQWDGKELKQ